jgi:hypothetical protein
VESHLLPASVYRLLRESGEKNPNPVIIASGGSVSTSIQITKKFLCKECEERFCARGEDYVMSQCCRGPGSFPLRQTLEAACPLGAYSNGVRVYDLDPMLGSRVGEIIYFAASIFWRSAATPWNAGKKKLNRIDLGPYEEQLRRFLLDEAPFPDHVYLSVRVLSEKDPELTALTPHSARRDDCWQHTFAIPGIFFLLFVGRTAPMAIKLASLTTTGTKIAFLGGVRGTNLFKGLLELVRKAPPRGSLKEEV